MPIAILISLQSVAQKPKLYYFIRLRGTYLSRLILIPLYIVLSCLSYVISHDITSYEFTLFSFRGTGYCCIKLPRLWWGITNSWQGGASCISGSLLGVVGAISTLS